MLIISFYIIKIKLNVGYYLNIQILRIKNRHVKYYTLQNSVAIT